ncbi:MAG: carboxypeptidase-like regulatory domain-containing protein [Myxococcota bacterium]
MRGVATAVFGVVLCATALACGPRPYDARPPVTPAGRGGISLIGPECAGVHSCLMGQVVAAETATPLARATIFLEREDAPNAETEDDVEASVRIMRITDDEGVFTVVDAPAGRYRLAVYKEERQYEVRGLTLGEPGTTMVPVRLPKAS